MSDGIVKSGTCSLGPCYIEYKNGLYHVTIGSSTYYNFGSFEDALRKFREFCSD